MANLSDVGLVGSGTTNNNFVTGTNIWASGSTTFDVDEDFNISTAVELLLDGDIIVSDIIAGVTGSTLSIRSGGVYVVGGVGTQGANNNLSLDWDNFTVQGDPGQYCFHGAFGNTNTPLLNIRNGQFEVHGNSADATEMYYLFFAGNIDPASSISNVSFWNGITPNNGDGPGGREILIKGAVPGLSPGANYAGLTLAPAGLWTNGAGNLVFERTIARFAGQGAAGFTNSNHACFVSNLDFRALSGIDTTTTPTNNGAGASFAAGLLVTDGGAGLRSWVINVDANAGAWFVNPFIGRPTVSGTDLANGRLAFVSRFGAGLVRVLSATNPTTTDGGHHQYTFPAADVANQDGQRLWRIPDTLPTGASLTGVVETAPGTHVISDTGSGVIGWGWEHQAHASSGIGGNDGTVANRIDFNSPTAKSYRKYSWLQQPDNGDGTASGFGRLITITPPPDGATDQQVQTAVDNGYNRLTATGWETEENGGVHNIDDVEDHYVATVDAVLVADTGTSDRVNVPNGATGHYGYTGLAGASVSDFVGVARDRAGSDVAVMAKILAWNEIADRVSTTNFRSTLPYASIGPALNFGSLNLEFDPASTGVGWGQIARTSIVFPATDIFADENVTELITSGNITLRGEVGSGDGLKLTLQCDELELAFGAAREYRDITFNANTIDQWRPFTTHTFENISFIGNTTIDIDGATAGEFHIDDVLGEGYQVLAGVITLNANAALTVDVPTSVFNSGSVVGGTNVTLNEVGDFFATVTHEDQSGTWAIYNTTTSSFVTAPVKYTIGGTPNTVTIDDISSLSYRVLWKRDNDSSAGWQTVSTNISSTGLTADSTETLTSTQIVPSLYNGTVVAGTSVVVVDAITQAPQSTAFTNDGIKVNITASVASAFTSASGPTQYLLLLATNSTEYMETYVDNDLTEDYIYPSSSETTEIDYDYVQLDTGVAGVQQGIVGVEASSASTTDIIPIVGTATVGGGAINIPSISIGQNPSGATPGQIQQGVLAAVGDQVEDTQNVAGWLTQSKGGIRGTYNSSTDYTINT